MTTKGYHRYRGRNTRGKVALVVVLVLILLAAVAYLLTQEYVVYDDEGKAHLELPWSRKEPKKPQPDSTPVPDDVDITREEPQRQKVEAIHAGLECGIIGTNYPKLDMISFGPTICYPHSPDEKVNIASVGKFYEFLVDTLKNAPLK